MAKLASNKSSSQPQSTSATTAPAAASAPGVWPPLSLSPHDRSRCLQICCHAQDLEVSGGSSNSSIVLHLQVQMACLLVLGDVAACRHLWRRHRDNQNNNDNNNSVRAAATVNLLEPWWNVAAAMMSNRYTAVWEGLQRLVASTNVPSYSNDSSCLSLPIIQTYATEIAQAYRHCLLKKAWMQQQQQQPIPAFLPDYYTTVFGFAQSRELQDYYQQFLIQQQQQRVDAQQQRSSTLTCFLEAQRRNL